MDFRVPTRASFLLAAIYACLTSVVMALDQAQDAADRKVDALDAVWDAENGKAQHQYFANANELALTFPDFEESDSSTAATRLLSDVLRRMPTSTTASDTAIEIGITDLVAVDTILGFLLSGGSETVGTILDKVTVLASALGRVRKESIKNYVPAEINRVMPPPNESGISVSGMDPKSIKDPIERKKYENAIRQNSINRVRNERQEMLTELESRHASKIVAFLRQQSRSGRVSDDALKRAMESARLTAEERAAITG